MTAQDFTLQLFCRVDDALPHLTKHPLSHLHPNEIITVGILQALRGGSFRSFYQWLSREMISLFPRLPERTRLHRLLVRWHHQASRFLAQPTLCGIVDCYGVEMLNTRRLGQTKHQWAKLGMSNRRWIAGAKLALVINSWGQVVDFEFDTANVSDLEFLPMIHRQSMLLMADQGFLLSHKPKKAAQNRRLGRVHCPNLLIAKRCQWPERKLIETVLALFSQVLNLKYLTQRQRPGLAARFAFAIAAYNLCVSWTGNVELHLAKFKL